MKGITLQHLQQHRDQLLEIFRKYHSSNVYVFGSVARGEATADSDVDFLCEPDYSKELDMYPMNLEDELRAYLNVDVDVVSPSILNNRFIGPVVKAEMIAL
ncbi:MAG: DNA polymerase subunit beta [Synechococcales cyanobacterium CRU_2_2]|nr:DNA polymerase subunit beta [Synechococcales cyanobacterium CRU_2_2]